MAAIPQTSLTQTFLGLTSLGNKIYNFVWVGTGTAAASEVTATITLSKLTKIKGTPAVSIVSNNEGSVHYIVSTSVSGNAITVTLDSDVGNGKVVTIAGEAVGV